jgi:hypothetical protein
VFSLVGEKKLEELREKKQGVVIPSKVTVKDIKKSVSTTKKKEDLYQNFPEI